MAHYAFLDDNNVVTHVIVGKDENEDGIDWEERYASIVGQTCKRTSYNTHDGVHKNGKTPFRKTYAGIGMIYNEELDIFIQPQPYPSWSFNKETENWEAPVPRPEMTEEVKQNNLTYDWNEDDGNWELISLNN